MSKILAIDDDSIIRTLLTNILTKAGYEVVTASDGETGLELASTTSPDLVVTDFQMPGISGLDVVTELQRTQPGLPVILLTAHGDVALTIKSIQLGAYDFIEKPIQMQELLDVIRNGLEVSKQSRSLTETISPEARKAIEDNLLVGKTPVMREIFKNIGRISLNKVNVLITGETGTGKELIARLIHYSGVTREHPLVVVNCSTLSERLLEHELFGYTSTAFPGNTTEKKGKFEQAGEGTLFLDEISELSDDIQTKLLRVLQELEFEKPGSDDTIPLKARIIAATNKDLESLVKSGKFREELYYRLKVFTIALPPLRQRKDDIAELVRHLVQKLNRKLNKRVLKIGDGVIDLLKTHEWPGNVRELENTLMQALIMTRSDVLEKEHIVLMHPAEDSTAEKFELKSIADIEKVHIKKVLDKVKWNKQEASRILEITRPTLNAKIEKYGLKH
ncbi:MAG: sigma-54-dependent Fis family transcriptional regulator [Lentimicrobiaceae bacterium]|nr:sigma-54-dependent Fis family transcriptional regulator [Lentimicrobiaceae bacterium]MCB9022951.1 sigma-54-dependent Fis family transcriptional regulator [Lentimicrobiaceae bacterium]MCO5266119.1 sigma-54 dependent transcriptional regulator [Lentimicrobium sp.]